jgi:hypothetical protein
MAKVTSWSLGDQVWENFDHLNVRGGEQNADYSRLRTTADRINCQKSHEIFTQAGHLTSSRVLIANSSKFDTTPMCLLSSHILDRLKDDMESSEVIAGGQ